MDIIIEFQFLENALISQKNLFAQLIKDIEAFDPVKYVENEKTKKEIMRQDLYSKNSEAQKKMIDDFVEFNFKPEFAYDKHFGSKFYEYSCILVLLSSCIIESYINFYLTLKIQETKLIEIYDDIEKIDILKKWTTLPLLFLPQYFLDKKGSIYYDLNTLTKQRNKLVHYKPSLKNDEGISIIKGAPLNLKKYKDEIGFIKRVLALPNKLINNLGNYDKSSTFLVFKNSVQSDKFI